MDFKHRTMWVLGATLGTGLLQPVVVCSQGLDPTGLSEQVERLHAGQETLRKQLQSLQGQLQEIRSLLQARPSEPAAAPQPSLPAELMTADAPFMGSPDAPLTIVEFSDFQCHFCARHWRQTYGQLDREYISLGKVRYVFRHFRSRAFTRRRSRRARPPSARRPKANSGRCTTDCSQTSRRSCPPTSWSMRKRSVLTKLASQRVSRGR